MPQRYIKNDSGFLQGCFYCFEGEGDCRLQRVNSLLGKPLQPLEALLA